MRRGMGGGEFEPAEERRDRELTLGPAMLLALVFGLLLLCGLFFGLGYAAGRRSPASAVAAGALPAAGQPMPAQTAGSLSKPPAAGLIPSAPQQSAVAELPQPSPADGSPTGNPLTSYGAAGAGSTAAPGQLLVRPALSPQANGPQPASAPGPGPQVQPALSQGSVWMVQIASVSDPEDANVLVAALRRHGYTTTFRRGPADGLIHVQVGPFSNRNDANAICQRLLADGYNAIVQP